MNKNIFEKTIFILSKEKTFFYISVAYGVAISILSLGVPIAVQSLVNTVTFGAYLQPLVIISIGLLLVLLFSGFFKGLQTYTIEMFQRHFYARTVTEITEKLVKADISEMRSINGTERVNRYFEIMTIQKKTTGLVTDFVSVLLQTVVGLILIGLYHPYFLVFDIFLILLLIGVWVFFVKPSTITAIDESKAKYNVANWLQETARLQNYFQSEKKISFVIQKSDKLVTDYLYKRKLHFNHLFSQTIYLLAVYAVLSAGVLALGGYLVVNGELSIGQLVAVELIISVILASIAKSGKHFESIYDLLAGIDKLYHIYSIESEDSLPYEENYQVDSISFKNVKIITPKCSFEYNFEISSGQNYYLNTDRNSSKAMFKDMILNYNREYEGHIYVNNTDINDVPKLSINKDIYWLEHDNNFQGTIENNLKCHGEIRNTELNWALDKVDLMSKINELPEKLQTELLPTGYPLWPTELFRFEIAKVLLIKPKFVIIGDNFKELDNQRRKDFLDAFRELSINIIFLYDEDLDTDKKIINVGEL